MSVMQIMQALSGLIDLVLPHHCAGCARPGTVWCRSCAASLGGLRRVHRPLLGDTPVYALGFYRGAARAAVVAYKETGRRDLAAPLAGQLCTALRALSSQPIAWWLVPAPSRARESRRRGGAHMTRIARRMAAEFPASSVAVADCLLTAASAKDSAKLEPQQRWENLAGRIVLRTERLPPPDAHIVLLDDVVTTGATAASSVAALGAAGRRVGLVLTLTATVG